MEVPIKIPSDIIRYVEYIPEEALPDILVDMIRTSIMSKSSDVGQIGTQLPMQSDMTALLAALQNQLAGSSQEPQQTLSNNSPKQSMDSVRVQDETISEMESNICEKAADLNIEEVYKAPVITDAGDFDDFMDLMK